MTKDMKEFFKDMAEVFENHNITMMEVVRSINLDEPGLDKVEGIEFTMVKDDNMDFEQIDGIWMCADDFRDKIKG